MKILSVSEMIAAEHKAIAAGTPQDQLMARAGHGLAAVILRRLKNKQLAHAKVVALVGSGNNGGDALLALMALAQAGCQCSVVSVVHRGSGDVLASQAAKMGIATTSMEKGDLTPEVLAWLNEADMVIDGILGTGFKGSLKPALAQALGAIKQVLLEQPKPAFVVAVDCPSGVQCDSGAAAPEVLPADLTVCMAAIKAGLLLQPAFSLCGEFESVDIGIEIEDWNFGPLQVLEERDIAALLPQRQWDAHKGSVGNALVCGGSAEYLGAPTLAAAGAYAVGAGLVRLAVPAFIQAAFASNLPEAIWALLPASDGALEEDGADLLAGFAANAKAVLLGPGIGRQPSTQKFTRKFFAMLNGHQKPVKPIGFGQAVTPVKALAKPAPPMVVDADGLRNLAELQEWWHLLPAGSVLTPHPGEMVALTGYTPDDVKMNREKVARRFAQVWGCTIILKGAQSIIAGPDGRTSMVPISAPALAKAGSGDVLAGMVVGLMAQGLPGYEAACCAAWLHAQAGLEVARKHGNQKTPLASDVVRSLRRVFSRFE